MATGSSAITGLQTEASTTTMTPKMEEVHVTTLPKADNTNFIETSTGISKTEATGAFTDIRLTTAAKEGATTDKLPSFTSNESPVTTNTLKESSNAAGTILGSV